MCRTKPKRITGSFPFLIVFLPNIPKTAPPSISPTPEVNDKWKKLNH